ncbi:MAG TPA: hypothetical protein PJ982_20305 [Lacipirellulaceae bacterium]|nr:hypothetical protein [Lacipirellulaceae bacterium]
MSFDLGLQRFGEGGKCAPKHTEVLEDMLAATRAAIDSEGSDCWIGSEEPNAFNVEMPGAQGTVKPDHALFQVQELDETTLRVIHAIAKTGDMAVMVEGGHYKAVLTDSKQRENLPSDWISKNDAIPVATTPKRLGQLIRSAFDAAEAYRQKVISSYDDTEPLDPSPWGVTDPSERLLYVQARRREKAITQLNHCFKHYRHEFLPGRVGLPAAGGSRGFGWSVRLPTGELFYGIMSSGDHAGWARVIKAFASSEDRLTATVEGDRFVLDDGRSFPLNECEPRRLTDED